tara:strand:+ start:71 stop:550 length:480 start_codon:yes stop_codon:yes gene_type:complete
MIINCINCNKTFEVNSTLIPENGRTIQCGACNHIWFYKPKMNVSEDETNSEIINPSSIEEKTQIKNEISQVQNRSNTNDIDNNEINNKKIKKKNKKNSFSIIKVFSYILVLIISFIAIVVILDTFKSSLSNIFPDIEIFLYNLFETVKDVYLFLKNLLS